MNSKTEKKIAIVGSKGIPARYGGFETLTENLAVENEKRGHPFDFLIYCYAGAYEDRPAQRHGAQLRYLWLKANGVQSIPYDILSMLLAVREGCDTVLLLGCSGAYGLPVLRLLAPKVRIITNIDGIEWRRAKWGPVASLVLRIAESLALRFSHELITDNAEIERYVAAEFGKPSNMIPYGGDNAIAHPPDPLDDIPPLPEKFALSICRIVPENNLDIILEAFTTEPSHHLVIIGNWDFSPYGRRLRKKYGKQASITLLDPIYDVGKLRTIRAQAAFYVHGHSAGGTNPSLVEIMHFGCPVIAHGCSFNCSTTENAAAYFTSTKDLVAHLQNMTEESLSKNGLAMKEIAERCYTWEKIADMHFKVFGKRLNDQSQDL